MAPFVSVPAKTDDNTCVQYHTSLPWASQGSLVCISHSGYSRFIKMLSLVIMLPQPWQT